MIIELSSPIVNYKEKHRIQHSYGILPAADKFFCCKNINLFRKVPEIIIIWLFPSLANKPVELEYIHTCQQIKILLLYFACQNPA